MPTDRSTATALALIFFLLSVGYAAGQSAGYALFVEAYGARALPTAILLMPLVGGLLTAGNLAAARRLALPGVILANVVAMIAIAVALSVVVSAGDARAVRFVLPLWDAAVNNLNNLVVWSIAGRLFDVRAAKRWGPIVASGRSLALVLGGVVVPVVVAAFGTASLYAVQAVLFAGAMTLVIRLARRRRSQLLTTRAGATASPPDTGSVRYLVAILVVVFCSMTAYVLVRNLFLDRAAAVRPDAADYAGVIAVVGAVQGAATFVSALFLGGPFLRRFGLRGGVLLLPIVLVGVYLPISALGLTTSAQFTLAAAGYIVSGAVMHAVRTPSIQVLYQPLGPATRARAVSIAEGIVEPAALGVAALVLLGVTRVAGWGAGGMAAAVALAGCLLGVAGFDAFRRYRVALERAVSRRWLRAGGVSIDDLTTREVLCADLERRPFEDVVALVGLLEGSAGGVEQVLIDLLGHPDPSVVEYALTRLRGSTRPEVVVAARSLTDPTQPEELRARATQVVAASIRQAPVEEWLADPSERVATMTLAGLLGAHDADIRRLGHEHASAWARSAAVEPRLRLARAAAEMEEPAAVPELDSLLVDPRPEVRRAAILAVGRCGDVSHVGRLVAELAGGERNAAAEALTRLGPAAARALGEAWADADHRTRARMVRVARRLDDPLATELLLRATADPRPGLRELGLRGLAERDHRVDGEATHARIGAELAALVGALRSSADVGGSAGDTAGEFSLLVAHDAIETTRRNLAWTLACDADRAISPSIAIGMTSDDPRQRAYALEAAELALPAALRPLVVALMTNDDPDRLLVALEARLPGANDATAPFPPNPWSTDLMDDIVERIITLRQVDLFAGLPVDTLVGIAELVEEVVVDEGVTLFEAGASGTSMFVVASGAVRVHHGDRQLDLRARHQTFGELSMLDSEVRSASVTAVEATRLYRLEQAPFYELMSDRPDVLRRMVHGVVAMLRSRLDDLARVTPVADR